MSLDNIRLLLFCIYIYIYPLAVHLDSIYFFSSMLAVDTIGSGVVGSSVWLSSANFIFSIGSVFDESAAAESTGEVNETGVPFTVTDTPSHVALLSLVIVDGVCDSLVHEETHCLPINPTSFFGEGERLSFLMGEACRFFIGDLSRLGGEASLGELAVTVMSQEGALSTGAWTAGSSFCALSAGARFCWFFFWAASALVWTVFSNLSMTRCTSLIADFLLSRVWKQYEQC